VVEEVLVKPWVLEEEEEAVVATTLLPLQVVEETEASTIVSEIQEQTVHRQVPMF
jgi:hypothetical protein